MFKPITKFVLLGLMALVSRSTNAQDALLWRISGNGLSKPSYLFGTMHLHCDPTFILKTEFNSAIDSADVVALELNFYDYDTRVAMLKSQMAKSEKSISSQLNPSQKNLVDSVCRALLNQPLSELDNRTPMVLMSRLFASSTIVSCAEPMPIDLIVAEFANGKGKQIFGLERFEFQDSLINSFADSLQINWLLDFCLHIDSFKREFTEMVKLYNGQKAIAMYSLMTRSPEMVVYKEQLLDDRNYRWLEFMKDNMKDVSIFMAVGAGHLGGENGLIAALRDAGYTVTPIIIK